MRRPVILITLLLVLSILISDWIVEDTPDILTSREGEEITLSGLVTKQVEKDEYYILYLDKVYVDNLEYSRKVKVNVYADYDYMLYKCVSLRGKVSLPQTRRNPRCFDYKVYLKSIDVYGIVSTYRIEETENYNSFLDRIALLKKKTSDYLKANLDDEAYSLVMGLTFADTSYMDEDLLEIFRKGGTAHTLAVSGLHIGCLYAFLGKLKRRKRSLSADIIITFILFCYALMTGFSASVMRAVIMIILHIISNHLEMRYDFLCAGCISMITILLINPMQIYNGGFQMSFMAVFTLAVMLPVISDKIKGMTGTILTVQAGMIPYTAYVYNYVSLASFISNIPVMILAGFMIPLGIMLIPLSHIPAAGIIGVKILGIFCNLLIWCNRLTYMDGLLTFNAVSPSFLLLIIYYGFSAAFFSEWGQIYRKRRDFNKFIKVGVIIFVSACLCAGVYSDGFGNDPIVFLDVGQGDCLHIHSRKDILVDGGGSPDYNVGENTLKPYLLKNGVSKIDIAFATHLHTDHYKGLCELSQSYRIDKLAVFAGNKVNEDTIRKECKCQEIIYLKKGDVLTIDKNLRVIVLGPDGNTLSSSEDENDNSLVLNVIYKGVSILMTADIDSEGESHLAGDVSCDILKAAHHGSKYSSSDSFLDKANPAMAVISVGKNNYGHPSDEVIGKFSERKIPYFRTDNSGAIGIEVGRNGKIRVDKMIEK